MPMDTVYTYPRHISTSQLTEKKVSGQRTYLFVSDAARPGTKVYRPLFPTAACLSTKLSETGYRTHSCHNPLPRHSPSPLSIQTVSSLQASSRPHRYYLSQPHNHPQQPQAYAFLILIL